MAVMVVHYKDGVEKAHHYVDDNALSQHIKFYTEAGYSSVTFSLDNYEKEFGVKPTPLMTKPEEINDPKEP